MIRRNLGFVFLLLGCGMLDADESRIRLTDVTSETGITFQHSDGSDGRHLIVEYVSAGLALFDYDGDGDVDIYFLNGAPARDRPSRPVRNALYRNDGNWKFTDVTQQAGVGDDQHGLGVTVGDFDQDGDPDLYVSNFGPNRLYRNEGDGTFTEVAKAAGVENGDRVGAGVCFVDIDQDGDLDLYVANYLKFSYDQQIDRTRQGFSVYASPLDFDPEADVLYRNNGDGTFVDFSEESGIASKLGYGMGMVATDFDSDGDSDLFVGNDVGANFVFQNDGKGQFKEIGLLSGFSYDRTGTIQGTMGVDCSDFDNDGHFDLHVTSYQNELATLYKNVNGVFLEDTTNLSGAGLGTNAEVTWGNGFVDFDNDGDRDIFVACGHLYPNVERFDDRTSYRARNILFENSGQGKFRNVTDSAGSGMQVKLSSRGAGFDDLDNDGDIDVVILNSREGPTLLRNDSPVKNYWLDIRLVGRRANREGVGARVELMTGDNKQVDEVRRGRGYQSHFGSDLHFGVGSHAKVDEIRVHWPGGGVDVVKDVLTNQRITIEQGQTSVQTERK